MSTVEKSLSQWRRRIFVAALVSVALCAVTEYWGIAGLGQVAAAFHHGDMAFALATEDMRDDVLQLRRFEKDVLLNVGAPARVQSYQAKWEDALLHLRYDLVRARRSAPAEIDPRLQTVIDAVAAYRSAFLQLCDNVRSGQLATAQEANAQADQFRESARTAEKTLAGISESALARTQTVDPALRAQQWALATSLAVFVALLGLTVSGLPRPRLADG